MRRISWSATLLLLLACSKDPEPNNVTPGTGGSPNRGGSGGTRTGGSPGTGGTGSGGVGVNTGGSGGGSGDTTADASGDGPADGGGDTNADGTGDGGGDTAPPTGGTTYILASAGTNYGTPSPVTTIKLDPATGALTKLTTFTGLNAAVYGAIAANKNFAYFVTEEMPAANIATFSIAPATGALTKIADVKTGAANGEYVGLHPNGKWLAVPHYTNGEVTVHPIADDGKVGAASDTKTAGTGTGVPAGCHQAIFDKSGENLFVACKAPQTIAQFKFAAGKLTANTPATAPGPGEIRHIAFAKDEKFAYGLTEKDNMLLTYAYDKATGKLTMQPEKLPATATTGGAMKPSASHILVHPTGKFLFTASRADNVIVTFSLDATTGKPTRTSENTDVGAPRDFDIEPSGKYLIAGSTPDGGKPGGEIVALSIDLTTGKLTKVGTPVKLDAFVWYVGTFTVP